MRKEEEVGREKEGKKGEKIMYNLVDVLCTSYVIPIYIYIYHTSSK